MSHTPITIDSEILNRLTHDLWFSADMIRHDEQRQILEVHLGVSRKRPAGELKLTVTGATAVTREDVAKIGTYQVDKIEVSDDRVVVHSAFPFRLEVTITERAAVNVAPD